MRIAEGDSHVGTSKLYMSTTRSVRDAVKWTSKMPVACCHTAQAPHPPDSDLTRCMRAALPWAAASPALQAAGTHGRATPPERRPERLLLRALPRRAPMRCAARRSCAAWEGSFEDGSWSFGIPKPTYSWHPWPCNAARWAPGAPAAQIPLPRRAQLRGAAPRYCAAWEGSFEDRSWSCGIPKPTHSWHPWPCNAARKRPGHQLLRYLSPDARCSALLRCPRGLLRERIQLPAAPRCSALLRRLGGVL